MALISMAVYDTKENSRTKYTKLTLEGLRKIDLTQHRVVIVDNASCEATKNLLDEYKEVLKVKKRNFLIVVNII